jgi:hypothetical protein
MYSGKLSNDIPIAEASRERLGQLMTSREDVALRSAA